MCPAAWERVPRRCRLPGRARSSGWPGKKGCLLTTPHPVSKRFRFKAKEVALPNQVLLGLALLLTGPVLARAQFDYITNNGTITITGYTGPGGNVILPGSINGLQVTGIGNDAFNVYPGLTGITIPASVTSIGQGAFNNCSLT